MEAPDHENHGRRKDEGCNPTDRPLDLAGYHLTDDSTNLTKWTFPEVQVPSGGYIDDFVATLGWARGSGINNSGIVNPDPLTGYPAFIDVESFVNHFIITELGRDQDAYVRSDYMFKDRGGKLHKGPLWDHNLIMGTGCCFDNKNPRGWQYRDNYNRGGRDHAWERDFGVWRTWPNARPHRDFARTGTD